MATQDTAETTEHYRWLPHYSICVSVEGRPCSCKRKTVIATIESARAEGQRQGRAEAIEKLQGLADLIIRTLRPGVDSFDARARDQQLGGVSPELTEWRESLDELIVEVAMADENASMLEIMKPVHDVKVEWLRDRLAQAIQEKADA